MSEIKSTVSPNNNFASKIVVDNDLRSAVIGLSPFTIGLGNVDDTSDADKPVSAATQTALDLKADVSDLIFHVENINNPHDVTADQIGLGNVDNTADVDKPISSATQTALNDKQPVGNYATGGGTATGTNTGDQDLTGFVHKSTTVNDKELSSNIILSATDIGLSNVDNTSDVDKPISSATQTALNFKTDVGHGHIISDITSLQTSLDGKSAVGHTHTSSAITDFNTAAAAASPVQSVAGRTGTVTLTKADVGLSSVDNTSDADKPIGTLTQQALNAKQPVGNYATGGGTATGSNTGDETESSIKTKLGISTISGVNTGDQDLSGLVLKTTTVNGQSLSANVTLTKADVGLSNVDNTSDADKPLSSATTLALGLKANLANPIFTGSVTLPRDPTAALEAATKEYVDNVASGIITKPSVLFATASNLDATYFNGTLGVGATLTSNVNGALTATAVDGVIGFGTGVLVKSQTTRAHNGRYFVSDVGSPSTPWILTRCGFCDEAHEIPGAYIFVQDGTFKGSGYVLIVDDPTTFVVGFDPINVFQFSGAGTYTASNGVVLIDNQFSADGTIARIADPVFTGTPGAPTAPPNTDNTQISTTAFAKKEADDAQAYAIQRINHTGTQDASTITGLGTLATQDGTFSGNSSGTNTGDQDLSGLVPYTGATGSVNLGANNFSVSTNTLFADASLSRVGIGTTSPTALLHVAGSSQFGGPINNTASDPSINLRSTGSNAANAGKINFSTSGGAEFCELGFNALANKIYFNYGTTEALVINSSANVGIGIATPTEKLDVVGNIKASGTVTGSNLSGTNTGDQDLSGLVPYTGATQAVNIGNNNLTVSTNTFFVDAVAKNVGIGTLTPQGNLHTVGSTTNSKFLGLFSQEGITPQNSATGGTVQNKMISVQGQNGAFYHGRDVTNSIDFVMGTSIIGEAFAGAMTNHNMSLRTNNVNRLTIEKTSGNVGIGTASPDEKLEVVGNIKASGTVTGGDMFSNGERVATVVDPVRTPLTGDGTTSTFAISGAAGLVNPSALIVAIDGILQEPDVNYSVSGGAITFTSPIPNGSKAVVISPTNVLQVSQNIPADGSVTSEKLDTDIEIAGQLTAPNQMLGEDDGVVTKSLLYEDRGIFLQRSKTTDTTKSVQALEDDDDFFIDIPDAGLWEITIIGVTSNEIACQIKATYIDWPIGTQQGESRIGRLNVGSVGINKGANPLTQHFYINQTAPNGTASSGGFFWRFIHKASQESKITVRWCRRTVADAGETTVYAGSSITARKLNN